MDSLLQNASEERQAEFLRRLSDPDAHERARIAATVYLERKLDAIGETAVLDQWQDHSREQDFRDLARTISRKAVDHDLVGFVLTAFRSALMRDGAR